MACAPEPTAAGAAGKRTLGPAPASGTTGSRPVEEVRVGDAVALGRRRVGLSWSVTGWPSPSRCAATTPGRSGSRRSTQPRRPSGQPGGRPEPLGAQRFTGWRPASRSSSIGSIRPGRRRSSKFSVPAHASSAASTGSAVVAVTRQQLPHLRRRGRPPAGAAWPRPVRRSTSGAARAAGSARRRGPGGRRPAGRPRRRGRRSPRHSAATSSAADCRPRRSPPAASPAARTASSRSARRSPRRDSQDGVHGPDDLGPGEDVALDRHVAVGDPAGPVQAAPTPCTSRPPRGRPHRPGGSRHRGRPR